MARSSRLPARLAAVALGYLLDRLVGEPPERLHPLRGFGALMAGVERCWYRDDRAAGVCYAAAGVGIGLLGGLVLRCTAAAAYLACGGRALAEAAWAVDGSLAEGDLGRARSAVRSLVSRDVEALEEEDLARAVVESVAENTLDAVVAPLFFAAVAGAPGALVYRAVNTLDAMVGYHRPRYERFGWASARLDDVAGFVPARLAVALVVLVRPWRASQVLGTVWRDASAHPSPNAGVVESAFAGALGIRFGGPSSYGGAIEIRPQLGEGRAPKRRDVEAAVTLSRHVGSAAAFLAVFGAWALHLGKARMPLRRCRENEAQRGTDGRSPSNSRPDHALSTCYERPSLPLRGFSRQLLRERPG